MTINIQYNGERVTATDEKENSVFYIKRGNLLEPLCASFEGVSYDKEEYRWKRSKRGAVSTAFLNWITDFDKDVYNKHYNL